ncbi:MAG: NAD(P)H-dependent oxidoreductase [Spirochaetales bacterium]|nr:NAD(P)H-dependent oxidoreductase [Spirochaetales bacterium]
MISNKERDMNILVVFSHPNRQSLNGEFLNKTLEGLRLNPAATEVKVLDLYSDGFDPALKFGEDKKRREMYRDPAFTDYRAQLSEADVLVFIYPIWWGRPPAMLLGYIDQLFASDFAYHQVPGRIMPEGLFKGKRAICISTMKGPGGYLFFMQRNAHKILMKRAVFGFVGIRSVRFFEFGNMEKENGRQAANLGRIKKYMMQLTK